MARIIGLDGKNSQPFEQLVLPLFMGALDRLGEAELIALGAEADDRPVGLLIAEAALSVKNPGAREPDHWEVRQVYVSPAERRQGIGRELLLALETSLRERGVRQLSLTYTLEESRRKDVDAFIVKCGWPAPVTESRQYRITRSRLNSRWIGSPGGVVRKYRLPAGVTIADFTTLTELEKGEIEAGRDAWYPAYLAPFDHYGLLWPENSWLLRVDGSVAGWIYSLKYPGGAVFYRGIFVKPEYRANAYGLYLLAAAINFQFEQGNDCAMFVINVKNRSMKGFIDYMLGGDYDYVWETKVTRQQLGQGEASGWIGESPLPESE